jgi:hypothetical protein
LVFPPFSLPLPSPRSFLLLPSLLLLGVVPCPRGCVNVGNGQQGGVNAITLTSTATSVTNA